MDWLRYLGRVLLAVGAIGIGIWATANNLIAMPAHQFWTGLLCYLLAAEVVWTLVERRGAHGRSALRAAGLMLVKNADRPDKVLPRWLHEGGRVRMDDIAADRDIQREVLLAVETAVMERVSGPRLHLLTGNPGGGRSTVLYRLARSLADAGQTVFMALPTPEPLALDKVIGAAKRLQGRQVYLLVDDLDLRPEAEEWLYELERHALPVVVVGTSRAPQQDLGEGDDLAVLEPAALMARAMLHDLRVTHNDVGVLARKLGAQARLARTGLSLDEFDNLLLASRALAGHAEQTGLWRDLDQGPDLPAEHKLMLAVAGVAEVAIPVPLWSRIFGDKSLSRWQKAGLVVVSEGLILPPHRLTCVDLMGADPAASAAVVLALSRMCEAALDPAPAFVARVLYALSRAPETTALAAAQARSLGVTEAPATWPEAVQRLWRRMLDALDLLPPNAADLAEYPPEVSALMRSAFARGEHERALALARRLVHMPVYQYAGHFAAALALAYLGRVPDAEQELAKVSGGVPGVHFLRGLLAEMSGDVLRALEAYEDSRKADEMQLSSTRRLAFAYVKSGGPRAAIPLFEALLAYRPLDPELYAGLAVAHLHAGMGQRAAAQSARAIQAGVEPVVARKAVARACAKVHAFTRVAAELEACLSYDQEDMESWRDLAEACHWLGRFPREEECLRRLQMASPEDDELCLQMARCQRDQGHAQATLELLEPLLTADRPDLRAVLLAAEVAAFDGDRETQQALARQAVQQGDDSGWAHYWLADSHAEVSDEAQAAYRRAIKLLEAQIKADATPRQAATLWQAIHLSAERLGDEELTTHAARKAGQEAAICEALGADIHSIAHRRAVPSDLFLETLPQFRIGVTTPPTEPAEPVAKSTAKPVTAPTDASMLRNRRVLRGTDPWLSPPQFPQHRPRDHHPRPLQRVHDLVDAQVAQHALEHEAVGVAHAELVHQQIARGRHRQVGGLVECLCRGEDGDVVGPLDQGPRADDARLQ